MYGADGKKRLLVAADGDGVELEIRLKNIDSHDALRAYVRRRIGFALGRFSLSIRRVTVRVTEAKTVRGRVDTECRIAARLIRASPIVLIERGPDLHAAIDRGVERLQRTMARRSAAFGRSDSTGPDRRGKTDDVDRGEPERQKLIE